MSSTKIISAVVVAVLAVGGITAFAMNSSKSPAVEKAMSKTSEVMTKTDDKTNMTADKMAMEKEAMMKKDAMSKSSDAMMKKDGETMMKADGTKMTADEMAMMKQDGVPGDGMMKKETISKEGDKMAMSKTGYIAYSAESITANADGTNIIFFHAPWCPTCKAAESDINTNLSAIPAKFNILKTDFDTSTALKQKYGVTSQSTFVKVDKDGNKLSIGNGFTKLADIVAFGQK
jgi:thiol-disulfide isomerase/thioredoxin